MYTIEEKTFLLKEKSLNFFVFSNRGKTFSCEVCTYYSKTVCSISISIVIFCVAKYESCAVSCTAFTFIFSPVVHSSHNLLD